MTAIFINPQLVVQKNDKFTTGIVYMPITLAYAISNFEKANIQTKLIDLYGRNPTKCSNKNNHLIFGEKVEDIDENEFENADCIFINANQVGNHISILNIIKFLKNRYKKIPISILENSQAVTAYSLSKIKDEFLKFGCDFILIGDLENVTVKLYNNLNNFEYLKTLNGIITKNFSNDKIDFVSNLDDLPFPSWEDFPLENYWMLGYSHGPLSDKKYLDEFAPAIINAGFKIIATSGTADYIEKLGYAVSRINKVTEGRPHIVDMLLNNEIDLVVNTTEGSQSIQDSASIRQSALRNRIFCTTTMFGAFAIIDALKSIEENWTYSTLQEINK